MKKTTKKIIILSILEVFLVIGGIVTDIVFWSYQYSHRAPDAVGHGVPLFSIVGIFLALLIGMIFSIIFAFKDKNKK